MESFCADFFGDLYRNGSLLGFLLLLYGSAVSALCISKKKNEPFNLSGIETSLYADIIEILSAPLIIWELTYSIWHTSFISGFFIWFISGLVLGLFERLFGFRSVPGIHSLLSGPAMALGLYMTITTHPF